MTEATAAPRTQRESDYAIWARGEGVPIYNGSYVSDLYTCEVADWPRMGQKGAIVSLADQEEDDGHVLEIAPGGKTEILHHLFESTIFVLEGRGATSIWQKGMPKQTVEWQRGTLFSPPVNCHYQHFNLDGQKQARFYSVTNTPMLMRIFRNPEFIFGDDFVFGDRYAAQDTYFTDPGERLGKRNWRTNFVPDLREFKLDDYKERGAGGTNMHFHLANNQMECHVSQFPPGTYKMAHRHGVGAHLVILDGVGYSLLSFAGQERIKVDWKDGSVLSPRMLEYHQHFNSGPTSASYLALRLGALSHSGIVQRTGDGDLATTAISEREGGLQVDYADEDPEVYELFVRECARHGAEVKLPRPQYLPR